GVGTPSDCSSDRPIVLSGNGWPAQNCEQERERETENMAAPECEREVRKRRERRDSGCAHERKERRPHSEERLPPPPPPPLQDYNRLESERRAERLSRARRPQFGKRRRTPARLPRQPKENDHVTAEESRCGTPPNFEYVIQQKPEVLKKSISKYENDFEVQNGRAISPGDRMTDLQLTRMIETLKRLQIEKRCIKTDPVEYALKETPKEPLQSPPTRETVEEIPSSTSSAKSATSEETPTNEGLHYLALEDLVRALAEAKMTKCILRRSIKEYESNFEMQNSRKVQRDDKKGKEEDYQKYKGLKARIKLLNALINKQKALQIDVSNGVNSWYLNNNTMFYNVVKDIMK
ncbi:unnamed protein product, partial [Leptidea sinapis]